MQRSEQPDDAIPHDGYVEDKDLLFYYDKLFPFRELSQWLTYGNQANIPESETNDPLFLAKREICLTCRRPAAAAPRIGRTTSSTSSSSSSITNGGTNTIDRSKGGNDEFFIRWQSFRTIDALKERLKDMNDLVAFKFDFGAVYSLPVSEKDCFPSGFKPTQKELVFDIDMNDYDDIRTCCKDKHVCKKCWLFLELAMSLLDIALREDFGFENIFWVFSGRRGVHCWVCDSAARLLPSEARAHLCEYLNLCTGTHQQLKKVALRPRLLGSGGGGGGGGGRSVYASQHHFVDRAFSIAYKNFHRLLEAQDFFNDMPVSHGTTDMTIDYGGGDGEGGEYDMTEAGGHISETPQHHHHHHQPHHQQQQHHHHQHHHPSAVVTTTGEGGGGGRGGGGGGMYSSHKVYYNYEKLLGYLPDFDDCSSNIHQHTHSSSSSSSSTGGLFNSNTTSSSTTSHSNGNIRSRFSSGGGGYHSNRGSISSSHSSSSSHNNNKEDAVMGGSGVLAQILTFIKRQQQRHKQQQRRLPDRGEEDSTTTTTSSSSFSFSSSSPSYSSLDLFNTLCLIAGCPLPDKFDGSPAALKCVPVYIKEIVLAYSYPRLDINVSKDIGHLLKSPFCVHPGTGRICVPLEPPPLRPSDFSEFFATFDPARVPTLKLLRQQFDDPARAHMPPDQRTSLSYYVRFFRERFLQKLLHSVAQENKYVKELLSIADASLKPELCF